MNREVPYFRPDLGEEEIAEVVAALRSGWITTGPRVKRFEREFAESVGARHAVAVNSCTAALHHALAARGLRPGEGVLVPTMTFAATAEVVRYLGGLPILVDCEPGTLNMDLEDAARKLDALRRGKLTSATPASTPVRGIIPVHVGGEMMDPQAVEAFSGREGLWVVEDAAHAFPASWRDGAGQAWRRCGEGTAEVSCFSFYANKTITTGEGGMATTDDDELARRMRMMSLHGLSNDAWERYSGGKTWDYRILAPGFKYNLTDVAAAIGIHQLARAETLRQKREAVAQAYRAALEGVEEVELPAFSSDRIHAWHLFPIRLRLDRLAIDRNAFLERLKGSWVGCSVHWRPLHLHPYYEETFGWTANLFPVATTEWERLISLPIFPGMTSEDVQHVARAIERIASETRSNARAAIGVGS